MVNASVKTNAEPVRATWKVSRVIQEYPELLEVLIQTDPAFSKLRNPVLRRVQSRLVTVEQAARIAGLEPATLVQRLNQHVGLESAPDDIADSADDAAPAPEAAPPWVAAATVAVELDVREFQRQGQEPFGAIMEAVRKVQVGEVLQLRNTFEPVPLYDVLGMRGFEHWAVKHADDDWEIRFYNTGSARQSASAPKPATSVAETPLDWEAPTATVTIDVSELVPPEPLIRILEALEELPDGGSLLVYHVRRPMHLYPRLDDLGYRHETRDVGPARVEVLIEKTVSASGDAP